MDELKKYLQSHRDQLGSEEPSDQVWMGIKDTIAPAKIIFMNLMTRWIVAASVILLAGIGIWQNYQPSKTTEPLVKQVPSIEHAEPSSASSNIIDTISKSITAALKVPEKKLAENRRTFPSATPITTIHTVNELSNADESKMEMMESSFTQVINLQKARISSTPLYAESPSYFKDFPLQMKQMEKDEKQIKWTHLLSLLSSPIRIAHAIIPVS